MEYLIVFSVIAMMTAYLWILARCLQHAETTIVYSPGRFRAIAPQPSADTAATILVELPGVPRFA